MSKLISGKIATLLLFALNLAVVIYLWVQVSGKLFGQTGGNYIALGTLCALIAFLLLLTQVLLMTRVRWIESVWGHDRLSVFHHYLGITAILFLVVHPIFLSAGYGLENGNNIVRQFIDFILNYDDVLNALFGLLALGSIVVISLVIVRRKLKYESWYFIHVLVYAAILLSFEHQTKFGRDLASQTAFVYWNILYYFVIANVLYFRFLRPVWVYWKNNFRVSAVNFENDKTTSIQITGRNLKDLNIKPGQFMIVRVLSQKLWWQAHPFSVSDDSTDRHIRFSIKAVGDFTQEVRMITPGTPVLLEGPLGLFTPDRAGQKPILMIAGGIGITPIRALYAYFSKENRPADLIYAAASENDFVLKGELESFKKENSHIFYKIGRLEINDLRKIQDLKSRFIYLCGPPPMMKAVRKMLLEIGLPAGQILHEKFKLG